MRTLIKFIFIILWLLNSASAIGGSDTFYLADSVDDTYSSTSGGGNYYNYAWCDFGPYTGSSLVSYLRYNANIPKGATITTAKISFYARATSGGAMDEYICSLAQSGSPAWRNSDGFHTDNYADEDALWAITNLAILTWDPVAAWSDNNWYDSPDISTLLQGQIDEANYSPGDATNGYIGFRIRYRTWAPCSVCYRRFDSYDSGGNPPELYVEWEESAGQVILISH